MRHAILAAACVLALKACATTGPDVPAGAVVGLARRKPPLGWGTPLTAKVPPGTNVIVYSPWSSHVTSHTGLPSLRGFSTIETIFLHV